MSNLITRRSANKLFFGGKSGVDAAGGGQCRVAYRNVKQKQAEIIGARHAGGTR